jgi:hypothetical protein
MSEPDLMTRHEIAQMLRCHHRSIFRVLMILMALATHTLAGEHDCLPVTVYFAPGGNCTGLIV